VLRAALSAYDQLIGLDLDDLSVDGSITKAPCGGEVAGRSPVDRGKHGTKRSVACDDQAFRCTWSRRGPTITTRRCWSPP
jgi:hypothetical protein